jgi:S-formylglutathione hydrolase FrmB
LTSLANDVAGWDWIIVMPDADNSWYTNSATVPQDKFEDYIANDVIAEIDARYRTIRDRHARALAGLSMGGYAAMKLALRDPQSFAFAGSLSGALDAARDLDTRRPEFAARLLEVFGPAGNPARAHNDVFQLLAPAAPAGLPYLYLACGGQDRFLSVNREFVAELSQRGVRYEYHETPGDHDWTYWDREIRPLLNAMRNYLSSQPQGRSR